MRRRGLFLIAALAACALVVLPTGALSKISNVTLGGGNLSITGTEGNDEISMRYVPGKTDPTKTFIEINDLGGVDALPAGCFRNTANSIHCPVELVDAISITLGGGDDTVEIEGELTEDMGLDGGGGNDDLESGDGNDDLEGGPGRDKLNGGKGRDDREGGPGNDTLEASPGNDTQNGGGGNDKLYGGPGKDNQKGGAGNDILLGGGGNDKQSGGGGNDRCNGGPGTETFTGCEFGLAY